MPADMANQRTTHPQRLNLGLNLPFVEGSMDGRTPRWEDIAAMARLAEEMGFDALWVSDHLGFEDAVDGWHGGWEAWTLLTALAGVTSRVQLGTYVLAVPLRNPAVLAKMAEAFDEVSGGRLILGLGAGWNEPEFRAFGVPFQDRFDRFEESLRVICAMLRTGSANLDGRLIQARDAAIRPRGPRPAGLPIMVGASGPRMLALTAELADQWNGGMRAPEELAPLLAALDAACLAIGREPRTISRSAEVLIRTIEADGGAPPEEHALRGDPTSVAAALRQFAGLGLAHVQVQLRPNSLEGLAAFRPIMAALGGDLH
jgi:probable F420-dependent oxidoreductase